MMENNKELIHRALLGDRKAQEELCVWGLRTIGRIR